MNTPRWAALHRTAHFFRARPLPLRARDPSLRSVHHPSRSASTTLQPQHQPCPPRILRRLRLHSPRASRAARCARCYSSQPSVNPTPHLGSPPSLSERLKKLSREYGWSALGVYLLLSALDFPFCFIAVRMLGTERIGHWEHVVVESIKSVVSIPFPNLGSSAPHEASEVAADIAAGDGSAVATMEGGSMHEPDDASKNDHASLWTQLALAYAVHKSFIFIRVPLTAAVLPKVVKTLRGWGWNIGKRTPKSK